MTSCKPVSCSRRTLHRAVSNCSPLTAPSAGYVPGFPHFDRQTPEQSPNKPRPCHLFSHLVTSCHILYLFVTSCHLCPFFPPIITAYIALWYTNRQLNCDLHSRYSSHFPKATKPPRHSSGIALHLPGTFSTLDVGGRVSPTPQPPLPPGKTRYPFYRSLGGPQGWSRRAEYLVSTGIRPRTVQPVAQSLYRLSYPAHVLQSACSKLYRHK